MASKSEFSKNYLLERFPPYKRGLYDTEGKPIILSPNLFQLGNLSQYPRVEYFSTLGEKPVYLDEAVPYLHPVEQSEFYIKHIINPLGDKVRADFPRRKKVGIRGTAVSLDGVLPYQDKINDVSFSNVDKVKDIQSILTDGSDSGKKIIDVSLFNLRSNNNLSDYTFPSHYLHSYPRGFSFSLKQFGYSYASVFPAFLVYDLRFLLKSGGLNIASAKSKGNDPLLKIYVLDYPVCDWS